MLPRDAATLVLVRDADAGGIEVLMLRRSPGLDFAGGAHVFPGGAVEGADAPESSAWGGRSDEEASSILGVDGGGLAFFVAAVRECFEEAGVLLASPVEATGRLVGRRRDAALTGRLERARVELAAGYTTLAQICRVEQLVPRLDRVFYLSHWLTPEGAPRRYDTRFFVAAAPGGQEPSHDGRETVASVWTSPGDALSAHARGEIELILPTAMTLEALGRFETASDLLGAAASAEQALGTVPRMGPREEGVRIPLPGDRPVKGAAVGATSVVVPGVRRVLAPNPSMMTGPGTNTYLVGTEDIAVIDPGPAHDGHLDAVAAAGEGRISRILVTHTHPDHAPGAEGLRRRTGATVVGFDDRDGLAPNAVVADGEVVSARGWSLRVVHTPGHASNHLCYLLEEHGLLFSGDHVMDGSTVVISPPDGDMTAYLDSLLRLQNLQPPLGAIAPGHGRTITDPAARLAGYLRHRLARERAVVEALTAAETATVAELVPAVYSDVPAERHEVASRSLWAHLRKLGAEGVASSDDTDDADAAWSIVS